MQEQMAIDSMCHSPIHIWASQVVLVANSLPADAGDFRHLGLVLELGRSPGGVHGNPLQYSCLENFMERGTYSP